MTRYFLLWFLCISIIVSWCSSASNADSDTSFTWELDALRNSRPARGAEINGTVKSIVWNEFTIETLDMWTGLNMQFDREAMQKMTDTERQDMMQKMMTARENAKKIDITVTIPVWIPILVRYAPTRWWQWFAQGGVGARWWQWQWWWLAASLWGNANQNAANRMLTGKQWTIEDIKKGYTVQIWLMTWSEDRAIAERVSVSQSALWWAGFPWWFGAGQWWGQWAWMWRQWQ